MTCHQLEPYVVDLARNQAGPSADADRHLRACATCAALLERERALTAGLRRLAQDLRDPSPGGEAALLASFDAAWARQPRSRVRLPVATGLAAAVALSVLVTWASRNAGDIPASAAPSAAAAPVEAPAVRLSLPDPATDSPAPGSAPPRTTGRTARRPMAVSAATEFVAWPGAAAWPPFESGELIRVELAFENGVVEADVLVGQDGFARAVRLVE